MNKSNSNSKNKMVNKSSLKPRSNIDESIFRARDRQATHWMIKSKLFLGFTEKSLK